MVFKKKKISCGFNIILLFEILHNTRGKNSNGNIELSILYITLTLTFVFAMEITELGKEKEVTKFPFRVQVLRELP